MAIGDEEILPAIVVVIKEADAEAEVLRIDSQPCPQAYITEAAVTIILVDGCHLIREIRSHQIEPAVVIVVADSHAHARQGYSVFIKGASGGHGNLAESSILVVVIKQTGSCIARNVDVRPPIIIKVGCGHAHAVRSRGPPSLAYEFLQGNAARIRHARALRYIFECPIPAVVIENIGAARKTLWAA